MNWFKRILSGRLARALTIYFGFWFLYFLWFWSNAVKITDLGSVLSGHVNIWGDWALHFTIGSAMAFRKLILFESPLLINAPFNYPFLGDFLSALLIRMGVPFFKSFTLPSYVFCCAIVVALFYFYRGLFNSVRVAIVASFLFLFNGGMGFLYFIEDVAASGFSLSTLFFPPREYTIIRDIHIDWMSVIGSMLIPQRSFQIGFPAALLSLILIMRNWGHLRDGSPNVKALVAAAVVMGLLPVIQVYSLMALFFILGFWMMGEMVYSGRQFFHSQWKGWVLILGVTSVVALPLLKVFVWPNLSQGGFFNWAPGSFSHAGKQNWFLFWWMNWGVTPIVSVFGMAIWIGAASHLRARVTRFFYAFVFAFFFVLVNLFRFQPWSWDNTKVLVWASLGISGFAGYFLCQWGFRISPAVAAVNRLLKNPSGVILRKPEADEESDLLSGTTTARFFAILRMTAVRVFQQHVNPYFRFSRDHFCITPPFRKMAAAFLLILMTLSGFLDAYRYSIPHLNKNEMYSAEDMYLADWVRSNTPPDSVWVAAPFHNHWLPNLTGRRVIMAFSGWLWTHGYEYGDISADLKKMFQDPDSSALFDKYGVNFIVIGPIEKRDFGADVAAFASRYQIILQTENYTLFSIQDIPMAKSLGSLAILDKNVKMTSRLRVGLKERVFAGIYFQGRLLRQRDGVTSLSFDYPRDSTKPFPAPYSLLWEGFLRVERGGIYEFYLASDDGSWLFLDDKMVIDNGGLHQVEEKRARVYLSSGLHRFRIKYFDHHGGAVFSLDWRPPGEERTEIPAQLLLSSG